MKIIEGMVIIGVLLFWVSGIFAAESYIGVILDGYQKNCTVMSRGEESNCPDHRQLFVGDEVVKRPSIKELRIQWAPYASGTQLSDKRLRVTFEPPPNKKDIRQALREFIGFVEHLETTATTRATRKPTEPAPGNNATLMAGIKTQFAKEFNGGKYIAFFDDKGTEIIKKEGQWPISLTPEEIGLSSGKIYTWKVGGVREGNPLNIKLLDHEMTSQIGTDLNKIEEEGDAPAVKSLRKAAYLQLISDTYPGEINLYWLSYQFLDEIHDINLLRTEDRSLLETLRANNLRHFRSGQ